MGTHGPGRSDPGGRARDWHLWFGGRLLLAQPDTHAVRCTGPPPRVYQAVGGQAEGPGGLAGTDSPTPTRLGPGGGPAGLRIPADQVTGASAPPPPLLWALLRPGPLGGGCHPSRIPRCLPSLARPHLANRETEAHVDPPPEIGPGGRHLRDRAPLPQPRPLSPAPGRGVPGSVRCLLTDWQIDAGMRDTVLVPMTPSPQAQLGTCCVLGHPRPLPAQQYPVRVSESPSPGFLSRLPAHARPGRQP